MQRIDIKKLVSMVNDILLHCGIKENQAYSIATNLVRADAYNVSTHGINILSSHVDRINRGGYNVTGDVVIEKETPVFSIINANNTVGLYSADYCMKLAVEKCKDCGLHMVLSRNSNTFGPAFNYSKIATDQGKIGICFSNSPANMPVTGGASKILGTNPLSIGIPGNKKGPILFDISTSIVAKSKINEARKENKKIPLGWALDEHGKETDDPVEAIKGMVLPMAGHKGYGLAMCIDILSGVISNAGYLDRVNRFYSEDNSCMNVGQTFIAIDPNIVDSEKFYDRVDEYITIIKESKKIEGQEIYYPGELGNAYYEECKVKGVPVNNETLEFIKKFLKSAGVECEE